MRDAKDIHVEHAIVHIVDHQRHDEPVLSEVELSLRSDPRLQQYFDAQVENALRDPAAGAARFAPKGDKTAAAQCYAVLQDPKQLIAASQHLAQSLFVAMGADKRIAPGSLGVCLYSASSYPRTPFLALIKVDPSEVLVQKIEKDRRGRRFVSFDIRGDVMPTARERLQKAALIQPKRARADYDLLLLDRQVTKVAANFFVTAFLNATSTLDARKRTDQLYMGLLSAYNRLTQSPVKGQPHLEPEQADVFLQQVDAALSNHTINTDTWVANLSMPDEAKQVIAQEITARLPEDREFGVDLEYAQEKLVRKLRFRGDYGVLIEMEADRYEDVVKERRELRQQDGRMVTRLVLEVSGLHLVKK